MFTPVASLPTEMYSTPCMLNASPSVLLASQCFSRQYHAQKAALRAKLTISGTVTARCSGSWVPTRVLPSAVEVLGWKAM